MKSVLLAGLAAILLSAPGFSQTPPSQAEGYRLVFSDDFTHFDLGTGGDGAHAWYPGVYFDKKEPSPDAISVTNSGLDLAWDRGSGQNDTSIEGCAHDAHYCNTFRYGYFEARMKWDVTNGAWPAFWMITRQSILGVRHVGEIDIFEGQGNDPTHYYGTINEWNGSNDLVTTNSPVNNRFELAATNDFSQWHTYGVLWVPGKVTWYFDDVPVGTASTPAIFDQQDFFLVLGSQEGNHWQWGNLTDVSAQTINLNVEWVHVFQDAQPSGHPAAPSIVTTTIPAPNSALPYAVAPVVRGGTAPYTFGISSGALPQGLQLNAASGIISNVPGDVLAAGPYRFTLQVTDAAGATATATYSGTVAAAAIVPNFASYALPVPSGVNGITTGPDGALWFTTPDQAGGNLIGRISTEGVIKTTAAANPLTETNLENFELATGGDISAGPGGKLWIAQRDGNGIGSIAADFSSQIAFLPPTSHSGPSQIAAAPDGTLWFTESVASKIAHIDATGKLAEFPTPTPSSSPAGIAFTPDGAVVFTEPRVNGIGYLSKDGSVSMDFPIPTPNSLPTSIVLGPDNAFWFTEWGANKIGRIDFAGNIQEVPVSSAPQAITVGPDLALYFTENAANKIGRITILGQVTEISIPEANSGPIGIASGPDGALWFTENNLSRIGRLSLAAAPVVNPLQATPPPHQAVASSPSRMQRRKGR